MTRVTHAKEKSRRNRSGTKASIYIRRAPFLISYWQGNQFIFENYLTRKKVAVSPAVAAILDFFGKPRRVQEIFLHIPEHSPVSLVKGINRLLEETLLEGSHRKSPQKDERQKALGQWRAWNPAASFFHLSTKDIYGDEVTPEEIEFVEQLAKTHPVPMPLKPYPRTHVIPLNREELLGEFPKVLRSRRTWREFSTRRVSKEALSTLLHLSFGVQAWEDVPTIGRLAQKTSPSGGALHPSEAYVVARKVDGISPGIYHYDSNGHRLEKLRLGVSSAEIQKYLAGQWWFRNAAFVVFLTAVFGRTQWKYDYARAYRAILIEAGHLCQTFCLTATWLGLAPFCTIALADTKIEKSLGLDGISESVIYAMGAGHKPQKK